MKPTTLFFACAALCAAVPAAAAPKNVILMIADGRSHAAIEATTYWRGTPPVYKGKAWTKGWSMTYSFGNDPVGNPLGYDPARAWESDGKGGLKPNQAYLKTNATDSASGVTAVVTGVKIKDSSINIAPGGQKLRNLAQIFDEAGRATGAVTTVQFTHATPAGAGAHVESRNSYVDIATEMIGEGILDVIMGAGNPLFDDNGKPLPTPKYNYIGEQNWNRLVDGSAGYTLIQDREAFRRLASGTTPERVAGLFQANGTAQQGRARWDAADTPGTDPKNENVPTLSEMVLGALNVLDNDPDGFFLLVEGGAVDWAAHANQAARLIEEHMDFDDAVAAVSSWVERNGGWGETLVVITSDHGNGMITGPDGETDVKDNGKGVMPGFKFNYTSHVNDLVPVFARGPGAKAVRAIVRDVDPVRGQYLDNTDVFRIITQSAGVR